MPLDFCQNNWKSTCACRLTENEQKKRQKVQKDKDENNWKSTCECRLTENEHKKRQKAQKERKMKYEKLENWLGQK